MGVKTEEEGKGGETFPALSAGQPLWGLAQVHMRVVWACRAIKTLLHALICQLKIKLIHNHTHSLQLGHSAAAATGKETKSETET